LEFLGTKRVIIIKVRMSEKIETIQKNNNNTKKDEISQKMKTIQKDDNDTKP
jgi:hypothetical protein